MFSALRPPDPRIISTRVLARPNPKDFCGAAQVPALSWRVGLIAFAQGEFDEVQALIRQTQLAREDTLDETRVLALSASAHRMTGDLVALREAAVRARAAARRCDDPRAWCSVHHVFALLTAAEGDGRQADAHCTDALRSAEASDDLLQLMWIRACRAFHQFEMGAPRQALADSQIVLSLSERCEDPFLVAHALTPAVVPAGASGCWRRRRTTSPQLLTSSAPRLLPHGFATRDLRALLAPLLGLAPATITAGQMSYDLRRLRAHELITASRVATATASPTPAYTTRCC